MPDVRVERLPVDVLGLGRLGFDHLQIVYRSGPAAVSSRQDDWFVIEGLREPHNTGVRLGVEGWHGGTTLSDANGGLEGSALVQRIGTPESRGPRSIVDGPEAVELWATLVSYATDIKAQSFPYVAMALPTSPLPVVNSSSLVASLLHHAGIPVESAMPSGLRLSPGRTTLLGTSGDDTLSTGSASGFSTILAGAGDDRLSGSDALREIDKLYGGRGDDTFRWSRGFDIVHGGEPGLDYAEDGTDTVDYSGTGRVRLEAPPPGPPHLVPDFIATYPGGEDHLFSIEEVVWDGASDHLLIGKGVGLAQRPLRLDLGGVAPTGRGDVLDLSEADTAFEVESGSDGTLKLAARDASANTGGLTVTGAEWIVGSPHGDRMVFAGTGSSLKGVEGGSGNDILHHRGPGPLAISGGAGDDTLIAGAASISVHGGAGADRFLIAAPTSALVIEDAAPEDRLFVTWSPAVLAAAYDPERPNDLLIRLFSAPFDARATAGSEPHAEVRVRGYRAGDLGLDVEYGLALSEEQDGLLMIIDGAPTPSALLSSESEALADFYDEGIHGEGYVAPPPLEMSDGFG